MIFNGIFIQTFNIVQGYEGVINYAGIVRGASQRAVKNELVGVDSTSIIISIDEILDEMNTGKGKRNIIYIQDSKFREEFVDIIEGWTNLKKEISDYREGGDRQELYIMSENFFEMTNHLVFTTQRIAEERMKFFNFFKIGFIALTIGVMVFLFMQSYRYVGLIENMRSLDEIAHRDKITGLPNRRSCDLEIEKYAGMKVLPDLLCISMDLNNLKYVNDTYGHFVGDRLITLFGKVLKEEIMPYGFACRNGGDEFMVFVEKCDKDRLDHLIKCIDRHIDLINEKEQIINIDYAWGAVLSSEDKDLTIYDLVELADRRMYRNKKNQKLRILEA